MKTATLYDDDGAEVEVRVSPVPTEAYFRIDELLLAAIRDMIGTPEPLAALCEAWAPLALVSWNFPEPATAEGMAARDPNFVLSIVRTWQNEVRAVPLPLLSRSSAIAASREPSTSRRRSRARSSSTSS